MLQPPLSAEILLEDTASLNILSAPLQLSAPSNIQPELVQSSVSNQPAPCSISGADDILVVSRKIADSSLEFQASQPSWPGCASDDLDTKHCSLNLSSSLALSPSRSSSHLSIPLRPAAVSPAALRRKLRKSFSSSSLSPDSVSSPSAEEATSSFDFSEVSLLACPPPPPVVPPPLDPLPPLLPSPQDPSPIAFESPAHSSASLLMSVCLPPEDQPLELSSPSAFLLSPKLKISMRDSIDDRSDNEEHAPKNTSRSKTTAAERSSPLNKKSLPQQVQLH